MWEEYTRSLRFRDTTQRLVLKQSDRALPLRAIDIRPGVQESCRYADAISQPGPETPSESHRA